METPFRTNGITMTNWMRNSFILPDSLNWKTVLSVDDCHYQADQPVPTQTHGVNNTGDCSSTVHTAKEDHAEEPHKGNNQKHIHDRNNNVKSLNEKSHNNPPSFIGWFQNQIWSHNSANQRIKPETSG